MCRLVTEGGDHTVEKRPSIRSERIGHEQRRVSVPAFGCPSFQHLPGTAFGFMIRQSALFVRGRSQKNMRAAAAVLQTVDQCRGQPEIGVQ